jgi:CHAT domain-containing protein
MKKMYELIKSGMGASEALNESQRWLKDPSMRHQHLEYLPEWCKKSDGKGFRKVASGTRFSPGPIDPEIILPEDLSRPYHWAGWICSGAD